MAAKIDISGDGGLFKEVLREGTGDATPKKGSQVKVHYVGTLEEDGSKFDSSRDRGQHFDFKIGMGQVIKGWDEGVATMKGELSVLTCRSDYAYGDSGSPPKIPGGATLLFEVELFDWEEPEPDTTPEKIELSLKRKEEGTAFYRDGKIKEAQAKYEAAAKLFEQMWALTDKEKTRVNADIRLPCILNVAQCQIKTGDTSGAISSCNKALEIDKKNVKATFRRGQAHLRAGNFVQARADLTEALKLNPELKEIRAELELLKKSEAEHKEKQKNLYAKMFAAPAQSS